MVSSTASPADRDPDRTPPQTSSLSSQSSRLDFQSLAKTLTLNLPIKLDRNNFVYWRALILPAIRALELEGFINSSKPEPQKYVKVNKEVIVNDEYS